jgi:hypothetical protein
MGTYTCDGTTANMYINGALDNTGTVFQRTAKSNGFIIGSNVELPWIYFDGYIDEFGIWDKVITQEEITTLYNNGNGLFY